jgi:hypothetical protein
MKYFKTKEESFATIKVACKVPVDAKSDLDLFLDKRKIKLDEFMADSIILSLNYLKKNKDTKDIFPKQSTK